MGLLNFESIPGLFFEYKPGEQETALALVQTMAHQEASFTEANVDASPLTYEEVCRLVAALERTNARHLNIGRDDRSRVFNKHPGDETLFHPDTKAINMDAMVAEGARDHGIYVYNKTMWKDQWRKTVDDFVPRVDGSHTGRLVWSNAMDLKIIAATGSKVKLDTEYCGYAWTKASSGKKRCDENRGKTTSLKGAIDESARRVEEADGDDPDESERRFYVMLAADIVTLAKVCGIEAARVLNVVHVCEAYVAHKRRTGRRSAGANYAPAGLHSSREPYRDIVAHIMSAASFIMVDDSVDFTLAWDRAGKLPAHEVFAGDPNVLNLATAYVEAAKVKRTARGIFSKEHASHIDKCEFDWDQVPAAFILAAMGAHGGRSLFNGSAALIEATTAIEAFPAANPALPCAARRLFEREHRRLSANFAAGRLSSTRRRKNASPISIVVAERAAELVHLLDLNPLLPVAAKRLVSVLISKRLISKRPPSTRRRKNASPISVVAFERAAELVHLLDLNPLLPVAAKRLVSVLISKRLISKRPPSTRLRKFACPISVVAFERAAQLDHLVDLNPLLPVAAKRLVGVLSSEGRRTAVQWTAVQKRPPSTRLATETRLRSLISVFVAERELDHLLNLNPLLPVAANRLVGVLSSEGRRKFRENDTSAAFAAFAQAAQLDHLLDLNPLLPVAANRLVGVLISEGWRKVSAGPRSNATVAFLRPSTIVAFERAAQLDHLLDRNPLLPVAANRLVGVLSSEGRRLARPAMAPSDDGYRWRLYKHEQYYQCTATNCPARKHVEGTPQKPRSIAHEGNHKHGNKHGNGDKRRWFPTDTQLALLNHHRAAGARSLYGNKHAILRMKIMAVLAKLGPVSGEKTLVNWFRHKQDKDRRIKRMEEEEEEDAGGELYPKWLLARWGCEHGRQRSQCKECKK